jgi:hypothetical protein
LFRLGRHKVCDVSCLDREYLSEKFEYIKVVVHAKKVGGMGRTTTNTHPANQKPAQD